MYLPLYKPGWQTRWAVTFACQLAFILFGYDQGVFSGIIGNEHFLEIMGHPNDSLTGIIVSIYNLGCFTGCIINFFIGDWLGRRKAMWFAMGWIIVGATLQTSAFGVPHIMVGRYIAGIGTGIEVRLFPSDEPRLLTMDRHPQYRCTKPN